MKMQRWPTVGFDIGGTNVRAVLLDEDGQLVGTSRRERPESPDAMVDVTVELTHQLADRIGVSVAAVGIGIAGIVDRSGVVYTSPNIPSLKSFPIRQRVADVLEIPVVADNDATTATWAEAATGAGRGYDDVLFAALGTGIGGGFVSDGEIRRGAFGFSGEIGHMIVDPSGPKCVCGRVGCWERFGSGTAFGQLAREHAARGDLPALVERAGSVEAIRGEHLSALVVEGEPGALGVLEIFGEHVAVGLNNLVNILDPSIVVIGGGLVDIGEPLIEAIRRGYQTVMVDHSVRPPLPIVAAQHGGRAGAIGAGLLAGLNDQKVDTGRLESQ